MWILVTNALRREADFRQLVVYYAGEAARHGAVYIEGIFSPIERTWRGVHWDEILTGYCDGAGRPRSGTASTSGSPPTSRGALRSRTP